MNTHRSILLAASLGLAACSSFPFQASPQLTVHVVEASGGA